MPTPKTPERPSDATGNSIFGNTIFDKIRSSHEDVERRAKEARKISPRTKLLMQPLSPSNPKSNKKSPGEPKLNHNENIMKHGFLPGMAKKPRPQDIPEKKEMR